MTENGFSQAELREGVSKLAYGNDDWTEGDFESGDVRLLGTGHGAAMEHFRRVGGRPKVKDKKVLLTLRMTESKLTAFKERTGRGWQTKLRDYVEQAISSGVL